MICERPGIVAPGLLSLRLSDLSGLILAASPVRESRLRLQGAKLVHRTLHILTHTCDTPNAIHTLGVAASPPREGAQVILQYPQSVDVWRNRATASIG